jgi:enoyl-[acyl-carrier protein] reductase II
MSISTRFTRAYGILHPIASAGMGFVGSTHELAFAVARAGAFGAIGVGLSSPADLAGTLGAYRDAIAAPVNINLITLLATEQHIDLLLETRPDVVSFHWGQPPHEWVTALHGAGIKVWQQVGSVEAAERALAQGVDLLVIQGVEAGGHNFAELPIFVAIPEFRRALGPEPLLLAAGGVCSGAALAAALALGADGAWVGSRLLASEEANAHPDYKQALISACGADTRLTSMFGRSMPQFNPMRVIANQVVREWEGREADMPPEDERLPQIGTIELGGQELPLRRFNAFVPTREMRGDTQEMPFLAGQGIGQISETLPAGLIVETMINEARWTIGSLASLVQV